MQSERRQLMAYHGKQALKDSYLVKVKAYIASHKLPGDRGDGGRMSKSGNYQYTATEATIDGSNNPFRYETEMGIPAWLAQMEDTIFNSLDEQRATEWPIKFLEVIPVGADLELIRPRFLHWLLVNEEHGVVRLVDGKYDYKNEYTTKVRDAISLVAEVLKKWYETGGIDKSAAESAFSAAGAAAIAAKASAPSTAKGLAAREVARRAAESALAAGLSTAASTPLSPAQSAIATRLYGESATRIEAEVAASHASLAIRQAAKSVAASTQLAESAATNNEIASSSAASAAWTVISEKLLRLLSEAHVLQ